MIITLFSKSKIDSLVQDLKKSYKINGNLPLKLFFFNSKNYFITFMFSNKIAI
jgi:hypothetical protein